MRNRSFSFRKPFILRVLAKNCYNKLYFSLPERIKQISRNSWCSKISGQNTQRWNLRNERVSAGGAGSSAKRVNKNNILQIWTKLESKLPTVEVAPEEDLLGPDPTLDMWKVTGPWLLDFVRIRLMSVSRQTILSCINFRGPRISRNLLYFLRQAKVKLVVTGFCKTS